MCSHAIPDLLFFSGDQLYENHGGYGLIREPAGPAILNYLRKYYMFGWAFREAMRDRPTLCIPDDHDVFQGNIWGEGGKPMDTGRGTSSLGGYREPARMVNVVHRTNASHHPDPFDPAPVEQDISVYYGDMVYGGVGFAILADRQFKSGPEHVDTGSGRADHVLDPELDTAALDAPGLALLGDRQEEFLEQLGRRLARPHDEGAAQPDRVRGRRDASRRLRRLPDRGSRLRRLAADAARPARPHPPEGEVPARLRRPAPAFARPVRRGRAARRLLGILHAGDQRRLPALVAARRGRHAAPEPASGTACRTPASSAIHWATGSTCTPSATRKSASRADPYERAHQKSSGFGLVTVDTEAKTYRIEAFRFLSTADSGDDDSQFPGWPVTLHQDENAGDNRVG